MLEASGAIGYIGFIGKEKFGEEMKKKCTLDGVKIKELIRNDICHGSTLLWSLDFKLYCLEPLDWTTRMNIVFGKYSKGIEVFAQEESDEDLKSTNQYGWS